MNPALFTFVLLSHAFDVGLLSCAAANGAASYRGQPPKRLVPEVTSSHAVSRPCSRRTVPENNLGPTNSSLEGKRKSILSGWLGEQFDLPYQMLPCVSLFQSVTKMQPQTQCLNAGGHVCVAEMFYFPLMPFNGPAVGSVVFA